MTDIAQLLTSSGVRKAVVVDDAFDEAPRADDLEVDSWNTFWDDIAAYESAISKIYPAYANTEREDLQDSDHFISSLWEHRDVLPAEVCNPLFKDYEQKSPRERGRLNELAASLRRLGLECTTLGREFADGARDADIVFIDLFLGFSQSQSDMDQAIKGIDGLVRGRESSPPLVILMSSSSGLAEKRNEFRDRAGLLGSTFRVISKADLAVPGKLETLLRRLAIHYEDAKRMAGFVHAWDAGLEQARKNFIRILRRLDLPDLAQIRALLLDFEGQMLGEYLLDVADRVLQHEIEDDDDTIVAALELNKINLREYPAPHLVGSPDLQDLVHRMLFSHSDRLRLSENEGKVQLQFGDVLRWKTEDGTELSDDVSLVVTPACDLVRNGVQHIMLLSGKLENLRAQNWSYKVSPVRTAIVILPEEERKWIRWRLKDVKTLSWSELDASLGGEEKVIRVGRLREVYAIEIQQKMLADMGRIGQPANPPATFPVSIMLYVVSPDTTTRVVPIEELTEAVCFVGRGKTPDRIERLILKETACDALRSEIQNFNAANVHASARASLEAMKASGDFFERFEQGLIEVPQKNGKWQEEKGGDGRVYLHVVRNEGVEDGYQTKGNHLKVPFVMKVSDIIPPQEK